MECRNINMTQPRVNEALAPESDLRNSRGLARDFESSIALQVAVARKHLNVQSGKELTEKPISSIECNETSRLYPTADNDPISGPQKLKFLSISRSFY